MKDFYSILGVSRQASPGEIKKSFRKRAFALHPDRSGKDTKAEFIELFEAYEVLSHPKQRRKYDRIYGENLTSGVAVVSEFEKEMSSTRQLAESYISDWSIFKRSVLLNLVLDLFLESNSLALASTASVIFGLWTFFRGVTNLAWDYSLIGFGLFAFGAFLFQKKVKKLMDELG